MSNEEKILSMLEKIQADVDTLKTDIAKLKAGEKINDEKPKMSSREALLKMATLFDDDEKEALGRYQAAEEARKVALYG